MKKILAFLFSSLFFLLSNAQVATFRSLGNASLERDTKGNFSEVKHYRVQEMRISIDLAQKKLQFFSKGLFDRDPFSLSKEITILSDITSPGIDSNQMTKVFYGTDEQDRKCIIRFTSTNDDYDVRDGKLQVEYFDRAEVYSLRNPKHKHFYNKG